MRYACCKCGSFVSNDLPDTAVIAASLFCIECVDKPKTFHLIKGGKNYVCETHGALGCPTCDGGVEVGNDHERLREH